MTLAEIFSAAVLASLCMTLAAGEFYLTLEYCNSECWTVAFNNFTTKGL